MKILSLVIKILILVVIIALGIFIYSTCSGSPLIQKIDKTLPDRSVAPFEIITESHLYYSKKAVKNDDESVTMEGWYERYGDKWIYHEKSVTLPPVLHPEIRRR